MAHIYGQPPGVYVQPAMQVRVPVVAVQVNQPGLGANQRGQVFALQVHTYIHTHTHTHAHTHTHTQTHAHTHKHTHTHTHTHTPV